MSLLTKVNYNLPCPFATERTIKVVQCIERCEGETAAIETRVHLAMAVQDKEQDSKRALTEPGRNE